MRTRYATRLKLRTWGLAVGALAGVALALVLPTHAQEKVPSADFANSIGPFLQDHCLRCHNPEKQRGKLDLQAIAREVGGKDIGRWKSIVERLTLGEMPPAGEPRPDALRTAAVLSWIKKGLAAAGENTAEIDDRLRLPGFGNRVDHEALFSGKITAPAASPARLWCMSPHIYTALMPRITGKKQGGKGSRIAQPFSLTSAEGFKDYADLYTIDEPTLEQLIRNAQAVVEIQTTKTNIGKVVKDFLPLVNEKTPPTDDQIRLAIRRQYQMALLREPTQEEIDRLAALMRKNMKESGQATGARVTLATVLMLPEALYRFERGSGKPDAHGRRLLSPGNSPTPLPSLSPTILPTRYCSRPPSPAASPPPRMSAAKCSAC